MTGDKTNALRRLLARDGADTAFFTFRCSLTGAKLAFPVPETR